MTKVKKNIFNHHQKVYIWFYIFKSIYPTASAVPKVPSLSYIVNQGIATLFPTPLPKIFYTNVYEIQGTIT